MAAAQLIDEARLDVGDGAILAVSAAGVDLWVRPLFGDRPVSLDIGALACCSPSELSEPPPRGLLILVRHGKPANLLLVLAQPISLPPVRLRARLFTARGRILHSARREQAHGFALRCPDPERALAALTRHGVARTGALSTWLARAD